MSYNRLRKKSGIKGAYSSACMVLLVAALCTIVGVRSNTHENDLVKREKQDNKPSFQKEMRLSASESDYYLPIESELSLRETEFNHGVGYSNITRYVNATKEEPVEEIQIEEEPIEVLPTYQEKLADFLEYSGIKDEEAFNKFARFFIDYSKSENINSIEDVLNMLYDASKVSMEEKLANALSYYALADNNDNYMFRVVEAVCEMEAKGDGTCYEDAYGVISTFYNRIHSKESIRYIHYLTGIDGTNMYAQAIAKNQFEVYSSGRYLKAMGRVDTFCYKAILDMLYLKVPVHDRSGFLSSEQKTSGSIQLVSGGNNYNSPIKDEDYTDVLEKNNEEKEKQKEITTKPREMNLLLENIK